MSVTNDLNYFLELFSIQIRKRKGHRWATFNTFGDKYPHSRNIIVRDFKENTIFLFTHSLSQKVEDIQKNPATSLCWYDNRHNIQLQFLGQTTIADKKTITRYQNNIQNFRDYQGPKPGTPLSSLIDEEIKFTVLQMQIDELVTLKIGKENHQKNKFVFQHNQITKTELTP